MQDTLAKHRIVLLGVGHTNSHVLKMWRMKPITDAELICVSNFRKATYSGMLPGVLSGQYETTAMEIDLVRLCAAAQAKLVIANASALDLQRRRLEFNDRGPLEFDYLSVGIGSQPTFGGVDGALDEVVTVKPMQTFLRRLDERIRSKCDAKDGTIDVVIVGAGAGGSEIAMCLPARLRSRFPNRTFRLSVVQSGESLLPGLARSTARRLERVHAKRDVQVLLGKRVKTISPSAVALTDGTSLNADIVIWATSAVAPALLRDFGLTVDERGFLLTKPTLQSVDDGSIFAVGDSGTIQSKNLPKAGVYAVRQGPVLWNNLKRSIRQAPLVDYRPQTGFLKLLNKGDGTGIGEYLGRSFEGSWVWKWKDHIDRKFMAMYQDYTPMQMNSEHAADEMRCAGCGGKVGGVVLHEALADIQITKRPEVIVGLDNPDDAAVLQLGENQVSFTTDFFKAPLNDDHLNGRIAVLNSLSDAWVMGARPVAALANIVLPVGHPKAQQRLLRDVLAGSIEELERANTSLVGGHTIEGDSLLVGFSVIANQTENMATKGNLKPGDMLLISKPLGSGILLAAHMQAACEAKWMKALVRTLLLSNESSAGLAMRLGARAVTDVTGFGLAGHLLEMLEASGVGAELQLDSIPLLPGVSELPEFESTLAPSNRASAEPKIRADESQRKTHAFRAIFDPQTSGGVLMALPPDVCEQEQELLAEAGFVKLGSVVQGRVEIRIT